MDIYVPTLIKFMSHTQRILLDSHRQVLLAGDDIDGRYILQAKLGEGGMGVVFLAKQTSTNRDVALKVMKLDKVDETSVERFRQEIDIISKLSHPNIVRVFDTGKIPNKDMIFVVMELVEGVSVNEVIWYKHAEEEYYKCRAQVELGLEIIYQICAALTEPHEQGIIHRDIKPENILLVPRSDETVQVKLLDFGVARVLKSKKKMTDNRVPFVGTPHYMAPEQVACSQYDVRTDLYSLGVVLFELLGGSYPFDDENLLALLLRKTQYDAPKLKEHIHGDFPYPEVLKLVDDLLARKVEDRPKDALEVRHRIDDLRDLYRFKRLRIDSRKMRELGQTHKIGEDAYFEGMSALFHPWMTMPSGKPLDVFKNNPADNFAPAPEVEEDEEDYAPTNIVEAPAFDPILTTSSIASKPIQHKIQSWQVDQEWSNSFDVNRLMRGVDEMKGMFDGLDPTSEKDESVEEAITTLWKADELSEVLDSYADMNFDDEPLSQPVPSHHTPSPRRLDTLDGVSQDNVDASANFAPLYHDTRDDVLTSLPGQKQASGIERAKTAAKLKALNLPIAPTETEDATSMADTQQLDALDVDISLHDMEEEPFVPASFAQDGPMSEDLQAFESQWSSSLDEQNDDIDPFADTVTADIPDDMRSILGQKNLDFNQLENLPSLHEASEVFSSGPSREINLPTALEPQFGAVPVQQGSSPDIELETSDEPPLELDLDALKRTESSPVQHEPEPTPAVQHVAAKATDIAPAPEKKKPVALIAIVVVIAIIVIAVAASKL